MANVHFLKGTQSNFNNLSSFQAGAFYLTTDTHRLYFADNTTSANYLNKYVHTISTENELKTAINDKVLMSGDFAYVSSINALVAINGTSYTQINAYTDTNDDTKVTGLTFTKSVDDSKDTITFSYVLNQTTTDVDGDSTGGPEVKGSFTIAGSDIKAIIPACAVKVGATVANSTATVNVSGTGSTGTGFTIKGSGSVSVGGGANAITINGVDTTSELSSAAGSNKITLTESDGTPYDVEIAAGTNLTVDGSVANKITLNHSTVNTSKTTSTATPAAGKTFTAVDTVEVSNGHVTKVNTKTITMPEEPKFRVSNIKTTDKDGTITITLKEENSGDEFECTSDAGLFVTVGSGKTKKFIGDDLEVYTIAEIDSKMKDLNAMVYKGTVGGASATVQSLPTTNVSRGDTYMVASAGKYDNQQCEAGDLLIATGTEGTNGYLSTITWTYVPSGDDIDTQYELTVTNGSNAANINLVPSTDDGDDADTVVIAAGNDIKVSGAGSTITVAHETFSTTGGKNNDVTLNHKDSITAITNITADNGHITGYKTTKFTLPEDRNTTYTLTGADNKITLTDSDGTPQHITVSNGSGTTASVSGNKLIINHAAYTTTPGTATGTLQHGNTFTAITAITTHANGHLKGYTTKTYTLPTQLTYALSGTAVSKSGNTLTITDTLTDGDGTTTFSTLGVTSSSLALTAGTSGYTIDLEWGSFDV